MRVARALISAIVLAPGAALAIEPELTSDTSLQFYEMRNASGSVVIPRRRFITMLGVSGYDLEGTPAKPGGRELFFRARLRLNGDAGVNGEEADPHDLARFVPGTAVAPVDLMYAYVEGRRYLGGWLGFRAGRQYTYDALGYWSFDGALLRVGSPFGVSVEGYAGLEQRGGLPLSSPRFERDGIWRGNRGGLDPNAWSTLQDAALAPAYGANLEWSRTLDFHAKLSYRRVDSTGTVSASAFDTALRAQRVQGARISSERLAASGDAMIGQLASIRAGAVYDLVLTAPTSFYGTLDVYATKLITVSVDYDYLRPSFDADSIWNWFLAYPSYDTGVRATWTPGRHWSLTAGGHARALFEPTLAGDKNDTRGQSITPDRDTRWNGGGSFSVRYTYDTGRYGLRAETTQGLEGHRSGGDFFAERTLDARFLMSARLSLYDFEDRDRPTRSALSWGLVGGVGYLFGPRARSMLEIENDVSATYGQRWRVVGSLGLAVF